MKIEYIPLIGFIVLTIRVATEQHACMNSGDPFGAICDHEWDTFGRFNISMAVTLGFIFLLRFILIIHTQYRGGNNG